MDSEDAAELDYMCEVDFLQTRLRDAGKPVDPIMAERILVNIQSTALSQVLDAMGKARELCWPGFTRELSNRTVGQS